MASTNNGPNVKFTYFCDPISPRTVTVARMLDGDKMYIDWAVNRMSRADVAYAHHNYVPQWYGDIFIKDIARTITRGRLLKRRYEITLKGNERKLEQMLEFMTTVPPKFIQDIVRRACDARVADAASKLQDDLKAITLAVDVE